MFTISEETHYRAWYVILYTIFWRWDKHEPQHQGSTGMVYIKPLGVNP